MNTDEDKERKISFKCCIPRKMSSCTDDELRLSIVTLKNAQINITVCIDRLERELKKRGASTSLLKNMRGEPTPELLEIATIRE
ncbi:MAG: hypothetical protein AM325_009620 [Candidatus Thorarchaeota archaeon SMTZ1-45]|nr:MAG: hypothetical protein AM325_11000 [Candidatus Thorarchaeota archaeon SMTZ1-45]